MYVCTGRVCIFTTKLPLDCGVIGNFHVLRSILHLQLLFPHSLAHRNLNFHLFLVGWGSVPELSFSFMFISITFTFESHRAT